jgi:hypothetical protein
MTSMRIFTGLPPEPIAQQKPASPYHN